MKGAIPLKKKAIPFLLFLVLLFAQPVYAEAASPRTATIWPSMAFNGTTAQCSVSVTADHFTDDIEIVVKLWRNGQCIKTWEDSGTGYLIFDRTTTVTRGYTYTMTADVTLDGALQPTVSVSKECK
jgi:hypothetical protein